MNICDVFSSLAFVSSRNEKEVIIKTNESDLLKKVLRYAYDPFLRFNLSTKIESFVGTGDLTFEESETNIFATLDKLVSRELSGNAAVQVIFDYSLNLNETSFELMKNIIKKDLRAGISDSTINKVFKNLVPTFDVQLAAAPDRIGKMCYPAYISPKLDGMRCVVVYDGSTVEFLSRGGKPITTLQHCVDDVITMMGGEPGVLDCEAMTDSFNGTMSSVKRKTAKDTDAKLHAFDYIPFEDFSRGECNLSQAERIAILASKILNLGADSTIVFVNHLIVKSEAEAIDVFNTYRAEGFEGAIVKATLAPYKFKRNDAWVKLKPFETGDFPVIGFEEGTGKYVGMLGALIIDLGDGITSRVGTGFSDEQRKEIWNNRTEYCDNIAEIEYMENTSNKEGTSRLRHSRFIRWRTLSGSKC